MVLATPPMTRKAARFHSSGENYGLARPTRQTPRGRKNAPAQSGPPDVPSDWGRTGPGRGLRPRIRGTPPPARLELGLGAAAAVLRHARRDDRPRLVPPPVRTGCEVPT